MVTREIARGAWMNPAETGLYYLQSRYYDPETGRFINADDISMLGANGDFASLNLYAYCGNNPISRADNGGEWWHLAVGAIIGVATQYISDVVWNLASGNSFTESLVPTSSLADYTAAAIGGALAASGIGLGGAIAANATLGGATYLVNAEISGERANVVDFTGAVVIGGLAGAIGGKGADGSKLRGVYNTAKDVLETAVSPKKIAMYTAKIASCKETVIEGVVRTFAAGMTSNALNNARKKVTLSMA